jgi:energy-coupling factor transporter ATP-binding protein EcfA2
VGKTAVRKLEEPELLERMRLVAEAFRPSAPIDRRALFAGRSDQIAELFSAVAQPGQHAVVYGERGVGKTSLAAVTAELLASSGALAVRTTCDSGDDFASVWRKALGEISLRSENRGIGFAPTANEVHRPASALLEGAEVTPHVVVRGLETLARLAPIVIFLDEFDRLASSSCRALFTDTIKALSDRVVPATIVLVGVADTVDELIREHRSVERALVQVRMPRMARADLAEIARRGIEAAQMTIRPPAVDRVTALSQGLPHYTHLLTQLAAQAALGERHADVGGREVDFAIERAIQRAQQSITDAYLRAEAAADGSGRHVLLACALAAEDEFGFFGLADVQSALARFGDVLVEAADLDRLAEEPAAVLQCRDAASEKRYRFLNPLLQPYVVMRGLSEGVVKPRDLR